MTIESQSLLICPYGLLLSLFNPAYRQAGTVANR